MLLGDGIARHESPSIGVASICITSAMMEVSGTS